MNVRASGPDEAPTVVFVHGGGVSGWTWEPVVELLPEYHCLVPDLPDHGRSIQEGPFSVRDAASRVASLIEERAHGGRAHLVGVSLGGQVVLQTLAVAPGLVNRAVVSGVLVRPFPLVLEASLPLLWLYMPFRNVDLLVRWNFRYNGFPERYLPQFREDTRLMTFERLARVLRENYAFRLPPGLRRVDVPTLALVGERELGIVHRSAMDVVAALPSSEGRIVPRGGHNWPVEQPDLCARVVRDWVEARPLPDALKPFR